MVKVLIKKLNPSVQLPSYKTNGASGMDIMAFIEKPINLPEKIVGLRIGNLREEKPWIDEEEDQSNYFWAHIELLRKNTAGSKSWYYDPDWLKIEAVHFKNLGVNKWHCLMKPGTTYIDAVDVQAEIRSSDDLFKTL